MLQMRLSTLRWFEIQTVERVGSLNPKELEVQQKNVSTVSIDPN